MELLSDVFRGLADYTPVLVGTFPLGLQVEGSDLDIACCAEDLDAFERTLRERFGTRTGFRTWRPGVQPAACVVAFECSGLHIEVFAQALPVVQQHAFRHMTVEARLLALGGEPLRTLVHHLKRRGLATEPAFACALHLPGDPYQAVLALEAHAPDELQLLIAHALRTPT